MPIDNEEELYRQEEADESSDDRQEKEEAEEVEALTNIWSPAKESSRGMAADSSADSTYASAGESKHPDETAKDASTPFESKEKQNADETLKKASKTVVETAKMDLREKVSEESERKEEKEEETLERASKAVVDAAKMDLREKVSDAGSSFYYDRPDEMQHQQHQEEKESMNPVREQKESIHAEGTALDEEVEREIKSFSQKESIPQQQQAQNQFSTLREERQSVEEDFEATKEDASKSQPVSAEAAFSETEADRALSFENSSGTERNSGAQGDAQRAAQAVAFGIKQGADTAQRKASDAVGRAKETLRNASDFWEASKEVASNQFEAAKRASAEAFTGFERKDEHSDAWQQAKEVVSSAGEKAKEVASSVGEKAAFAASKTAGAVESSATSIPQKLSGMANAASDSALEKAEPFAERVAYVASELDLEDLAKKAEAGLESGTKSASSVASSAKSEASAAWDSAKSSASSAMDSVRSGGESTVSALKSGTEQAASSAMESIKSGTEHASSTLSSIKQGAEQALDTAKHQAGHATSVMISALDSAKSKASEASASAKYASSHDENLHESAMRETLGKGKGKLAFDAFNEASKEEQEVVQVVGKEAIKVQAKGDPTKNISGKAFAQVVLEAMEEHAPLVSELGPGHGPKPVPDPHEGKGGGVVETIKRQAASTFGIIIEQLPSEFAEELKAQDESEQEKAKPSNRAFGVSSPSRSFSPEENREQQHRVASNAASAASLPELVNRQDLIASSLNSAVYVGTNDPNAFANEIGDDKERLKQSLLRAMYGELDDDEFKGLGLKEDLMSSLLFVESYEGDDVPEQKKQKEQKEDNQQGLWDSIKGRAKSLLGMSNANSDDPEGQGNEIGGLAKEMILGSKDANAPGDGKSKSGKEMDELRNRIRLVKQQQKVPEEETQLHVGEVNTDKLEEERMRKKKQGWMSRMMVSMKAKL